MLWISLHYATFGLILKDDRIVLAPPIARWTIGKHYKAVVPYYERKGALVKWV